MSVSERNSKEEEEFKNKMQRLKLNDQKMTYLQLFGYQLGVQKMQALSDALKVNQTLTHLEISLNRIGDKVIEALSEALKVNQSITNLILSYNLIGANGIEALNESLKENQTITKLNLYEKLEWKKRECKLYLNL
ncbi:leucine rich repeat family protein [Anaeramoeba flamelloides]|uniref:Leucine rich repeat family protein n=1 Tax=Anaeramoeba flamelloides TaxID=1746091 RepID=A0ABQ8ZF93_9EUKA|nr:leucine rich repeat family protein [Anaeramoeba flamelloides]